MTNILPDRTSIEAYWEAPNTVSLLDENLRMLEEQFVLPYLHSQMNFADLGCGGGESTVKYANKVKSCVALEQSSRLRALATKRANDAGLQNVEIIDGSVLDLSKYENRFHCVVTQRVVINFMSWAEQKEVIKNIRSTLRHGGQYLMIENTFEGFEAMNSLRRAVALPNVPLHDWHNQFLYHDQLVNFLGEIFVIEKVHTFSLYYLLTRVYVNMFAKFEGFGANAKQDEIFKMADAAARRLYEIYGHKIKFNLDVGDSFGPIQGFVLRRFD
jgi:ubiquinone/menaquinone biosynthesis C-methylase UbiE